MFKLPRQLIVYSAIKTAEYMHAYNFHVAILTLTGFPLFYFIWHDIFPQPYENLYIRIFGVVLFLPLFFSAIWRRKSQNTFICYAFILLCFIPCFFFFMLIKNDFNEVWILSVIAGLLVLVLLSYDWIIVFISFVVGFVSACLLSEITPGSTTQTLLDNLRIDYLPTYLFMIVVGGFLNHKKNTIFQEKARLLQALGGSIAHEIGTPLTKINFENEKTAELMKSFKSYAQSTGSTEIAMHEIQSVLDSANNIDKTIAHMQTLKNIQLMNIRGLENINLQEPENFSISEIVHTCLQDYSYLLESTKVNFNSENDFQVKAVKTLLLFVLLNLTKNAVYALKRQSNPIIDIWLDAEKRQLHFKDYGDGITKEKQANIFTSFNTTKIHHEGAGLGLFFCKQVMQNFGGDIRCDSKFGAYTEFILYFPA